MASSSYCLFVVYFAVLLISALSQTSTKPIDAICQHVGDKDFCVKSLIKYPPAVSATTTLEAAVAALRLVMSYADNFAYFAGKAAKENPNLKKQFEECQEHFQRITSNLKGATGALVDLPEMAYYEALICTDETTMVKNLIGKNTDKNSKNIMKLTLRMENLIDVAVGATEAVSG